MKLNTNGCLYIVQIIAWIIVILPVKITRELQWLFGYQKRPIITALITTISAGGPRWAVMAGKRFAGTNDWSFHPSYTLVEDNIFDQCDGEIEIILVKSLYNTIRRNLFYESDGMLTLRHGNYNTVRDNFFIGNGKKNAGGVRIIGEHHTVSNDYMQGLRGTGIMSAISIMNTVENPKLNEYWIVKNAVIDSNIIIDCSEAFVIGSGKDAVRKVPPDSLFISYNYIQNAGSTVIENEKIKNLFAACNMVWRSAAPAGFTKSPKQILQKDSKDVWQLPGGNRQPFWLSEAIGPEWDSEIKKSLAAIKIR